MKELGTYSVHELFFLIAYCIWLIFMVLNTSLFSARLVSMTLMVRAFCYFLLFTSMLSSTQFTPKWLSAFIIAIPLVACGICSSDAVILDGVAFVFCGRDIDFRKIAKCSAVIILSSVALVVSCSFLNILPSFVAWAGGRERSFLGYRYALYPASFMFFGTCLVVYLNDMRLRLVHAIALLAANIFIYSYTTSRVSFFMSVLVIAVSLICSRLPAMSRRLGRPHGTAFSALVAILWPAMAILSIGMALLYTNTSSFFVNLNKVDLLGGRLSIARNALTSYPPTLFGRQIHFVGAALGADATNADAVGMNLFKQYDYIDNLFVKMIVNYGVVFFFLIVVLMMRAMWLSCRRGEDALTLILVAICIHCTIDTAGICLYYDTFLFLLASTYWEVSPHAVVEPATGPKEEEKPEEDSNTRYLLPPAAGEHLRPNIGNEDGDVDFGEHYDFLYDYDLAPDAENLTAATKAESDERVPKLSGLSDGEDVATDDGTDEDITFDQPYDFLYE